MVYFLERSLPPCEYFRYRVRSILRKGGKKAKAIKGLKKQRYLKMIDTQSQCIKKKKLMSDVLIRATSWIKEHILYHLGNPKP